LPVGAALSSAQLGQFDRDGYLLVRQAIDPDRYLGPVLREYEQLLDALAEELLARGEVSRSHRELPFEGRFVEICAESNQTNAQYFDFSLPQAGITRDTPMWHGPAVFNMLRCEDLLDLVECLIGPEIYSNPVQHVRIKAPESREPRDPVTGALKMGATNWHQDNGVVLPEADHTDILTVWFPLRSAGIEHGCLQVVPGSHRRGLLDHCPAGPGGLEVPERVASRDDAVPLPMEPGDVLLLHKLTLHSSLSNLSNEIRISFDLRYNPIGQPTGRPAFPGFVARSRSAPETELHDAGEWASMWVDARAALAAAGHDQAFNRWSAQAPACA
jgi:phytanoyl-CoA hydroxylase